MRFASYWLDTAPPLSCVARGRLPARVDVAVVGGGFTGLSAALALAKSGATVLVLEAGHLFGGASGRNGGQCNTGLAVDYAGLVETYGRPAAQALSRAFDAAVDTVERIVMDEGIGCGFERNGKLKLAAKPAHFDKMQRSIEGIVRDLDPGARLLDAGGVAREVGSDAFHGGIVYPRSASLHVGRFGAGLAGAAARQGAILTERTPVLSLDRLGGRRHRVRTDRGDVEAGMVLNCTGASAIAPMGFLRRRIVPVGSFIIVTRPFEAWQAAAVMTGNRNCTTTRHVGHYFRMIRDEAGVRLLFGGRARFALSGRESDEKSGRILVATMRGMFPSLQTQEAEYCWGGIVDMTRDRLPHAGEQDGLFYAAGYSGHGVQMSVHLGEAMAAVMGGDTGRNPFAALDWPAIPGHFGRPWFLPVVGAYYKARDLVE